MAAVSFGGPALWYATRAAGIVTLLLLTATTGLGILTGAQLSTRRWPRLLVVGLHRNLSVLALVFLGLHVTTTVVDSYTSISAQDAVIPFLSGYHRFWLGLGAIASDMIIALLLTSMLRRWIRYRFWRLVHWCGYACWPIALAHGLGIGTDRDQAWMFGLTLGCVGVVVAALTVRIVLLLPRPAVRVPERETTGVPR
jgi:methionine sulfoxide reductase heme-binding subunit